MSTAHAHYDTSDNLHVMIYGRKRFLLFPPLCVLRCFRLFPSVSAHYRHSQDDLSRWPSEKGECSGCRGVVDVEVGAGQTLFMPAYWGHAVQTHSPLSISVNVWSRKTHSLTERGDL